MKKLFILLLAFAFMMVVGGNTQLLAAAPGFESSGAMILKQANISPSSSCASLDVNRNATVPTSSTMLLAARALSIMQQLTGAEITNDVAFNPFQRLMTQAQMVELVYSVLVANLATPQIMLGAETYITVEINLFTCRPLAPPGEGFACVAVNKLATDLWTGMDTRAIPVIFMGALNDNTNNVMGIIDTAGYQGQYYVNVNRTAIGSLTGAFNRSSDMHKDLVLAVVNTLLEVNQALALSPFSFAAAANTSGPNGFTLMCGVATHTKVPILTASAANANSGSYHLRL